MHQVLLVSEIAACFADLVLGNCDGDTERDWKSVAALARTCKALYEPAMDTLWRVQVDLYYLIKCMPQDAWEEYLLGYPSIDGWKRKLFFRRPLYHKDFKRIAHLTTRIRTLIFLPAVSNMVDSMDATLRYFPRASSVLSGEAYEELGRYFHLTSLMPKLRTLWMLDPMRDEIYRAPFLFNPTLNSVLMTAEARYTEIGGAHYAQGVICSALTLMQRGAPRTESLFIATFAERRAGVDIPVLPDVLMNLKYLRQVHLIGIAPTFHAYSAMRSLPHLRELRFEISETCDLVAEGFRASTTTRTLPGPSFPSLTTMYLMSDSLLSSASVLALFPLPALTHFSTSATLDALDVLFRALSDRLDHAVVTSIKLYHSGFAPSGDWEASAPITGHTLAPLFAFTRLTELCVRARMALDDNDVSSIAAAWPALERLSVYSADDEHPPRVTWRGLRNLVERCPALRGLGISFTMDAPGLACMRDARRGVDAQGNADVDSAECGELTGREARGKIVQNELVTHIHAGVFCIEDSVTHEETGEALVALFAKLQVILTDDEQIDVGEDNTRGGVWAKSGLNFLNMW